VVARPEAILTCSRGLHRAKLSLRRCASCASEGSPVPLPHIRALFRTTSPTFSLVSALHPITRLPPLGVLAPPYPSRVLRSLGPSLQRLRPSFANDPLFRTPRLTSAATLEKER